jgi:hypothetical protein
MRAALALAAVFTLSLAGCSSANDPTVRLSQAPARSSIPSSAPGPRSGGVASEVAAGRELAKFSRLNRWTIARNRRPDGRAFIDGLVAAGYRRAAMEVTEDRTTIGLPAPSVQFSVLWRGVCLVGQYGPESGGYHGVTVPPVDGRCLIGKTRRIDW